MSHIALVVLAAGLSRRFGSADKLLAPFDGAPLAAHCAATFGGLDFAQRVAVTANAQVEELFTARGFSLCTNAEPQTGQGASLRLGIEAVTQERPVMVALADMPCVTPDHIGALCAHFEGARPVCSHDGHTRLPPALFPYSMLLSLGPGTDQGAKKLLAGAHAITAPAQTLRDFDTPRDWVAP